MRKILLYLFIILTLSCQKNQEIVSVFDNIDDENLVSVLKFKFNLSSFNIAPTTSQLAAITKTLKSTPKYRSVYSILNINSLRIFENKQENITIAMCYFKNNTEKLFSIKGYLLNDEFIIINNFIFERVLKNHQNGEIIITNNDDATLIKLVNGSQVFSSIKNDSFNFKSMLIKDCEGNHGGTGFCQRQDGEKFGDCYRAEKDEFCDSFISCLAAETQPQVMLLIAASCGCSAAPCTVK